MPTIRVASNGTSSTTSKVRISASRGINGEFVYSTIFVLTTLCTSSTTSSYFTSVAYSTTTNIPIDSSSSAALGITIIVANRIRTVVVRFSEELDICPISIALLSTSYSSEGSASYTFN